MVSAAGEAHRLAARPVPGGAGGAAGAHENFVWHRGRSLTSSRTWGLISALQRGHHDAPVARVHALLADAAAHYRDALRASPQAVRYLLGRGISGATAARFGLGFARPKWRDLGPVLQRYDEGTTLASGLLAVSGDGPHARRFDRFRDRLMFPIRNRAGGVAGFGGRVIVGEGGPKYLNSPEGVAFRKGELLYGLYEAQHAIQVDGLAVLVEGYLDVVSVAQSGFAPVVGMLGTTCSREQISELLTLAPRLVFCFDGDKAGQRAAERALKTVLPLASDTCTIEFVLLPEDHDPDSFVRAHGLEGFQAALASATPLADFLIQCASAGCDLQYPEGRARCAHRARPLWHLLPDGNVRSSLANYCAGMLRFSMDELLDLWHR